MAELYRVFVSESTWKNSQALDYFTTSGLHGNSVIAHQQREHDQSHKLAGVGLQREKGKR